MRPFGMRPVWRGNSRMIDSAETDLPDPDSPTMATISPRIDVKAQALDRAHDAARGRKLDVQVLDLEQSRSPARTADPARNAFHPLFDGAHAIILYYPQLRGYS